MTLKFLIRGAVKLMTEKVLRERRWLPFGHISMGHPFEDV